MADMMKKVPVREQDAKERACNFEEVCLGYNADEAVAEAQRCLNCKNAHCVQGCPVSINIPGFVEKVKEGDFAAAYQVISESSALPAVCGRVCPQESQCEGKCIRGIKGECSAASQGRVGVKRLFDFVESGDIWHSKYGEKAVPFELVMDLVTVNQLDKFHYLPRTNAGNGTLLKGTVSYSMNKEQWTEAGTFEWQRDDEVKVFNFTQHPTARYIKLSVTEAVGNYGSGKEIYVFKVPGTESYLQGDINVDGKIDGNDLTSYTNYTGLRKGDSDFEGYISNGDINKNGLIDAYDISVVATQLEGGVDNRGTEKVDGTIEISTSKQVYDKDEIIEIQVKGVDLRAVNAFSFALPYNQQDYEFVGVELQHMNAMENLTYDRLHSNGSKALYPTFVNVGNKKTLEGTVDLFLLKFKAKRQVKFGLKIIDGLLVDKRLNTRRSGVQ